MNLDEAKTIMLTEMEMHGLDDWNFAWSRAKGFLGMCSYSEQTLYLSKPLTEVNTLATMTDTIRHEIAHALVGPGKGHGAEWKAMARALGVKPRAADKNAVTVPKKYFAVHHCGRKFSRDRLPSSRRYCTACWNASGKDRQVSILTWVDRKTNTEVGTVSLRAAQRIG
jgi:predicted SprT family Zn-dependent metalloprotease